MKQNATIAVLSALTFGVGNCTAKTPSGNTVSPQSEVSPANAVKIQVITTFLPITQFTKAVAGDRAQVTQLLPTNIGPHDYQAKPEDAQKIANANVLVQNGLQMEEFLDDLVKNAENPKLKIIDTSQGIQPITTEAVAGHPHEHPANENGLYNPHIWLDPKRAIQQVETIRDGLIAADPAGKAIYTANAAAYIGQLQTLNREIAKTLQPYAGKTFVTFHDFAPYFAQRYNLKTDFLVDVPEENPSPEDVKRVVKAVQASDLKTLLTEPEAGEGTFASLAGDLKVKVSVFDSLEAGGPDAVKPEYYLTVMRKNLNSLKTAFGSASVKSALPLEPLQAIGWVNLNGAALLGGWLG